MIENARRTRVSLITQFVIVESVLRVRYLCLRVHSAFACKMPLLALGLMCARDDRVSFDRPCGDDQRYLLYKISIKARPSTRATTLYTRIRCKGAFTYDVSSRGGRGFRNAGRGSKPC